LYLYISDKKRTTYELERKKENPMTEDANQPTPKKYKGPTEADFYKPLYNKPVILALTDGKTYRGFLAGVDRFYLLVQTKQGLTLFSKHAIKYVIAGKEAENGVETQ
jgi:sRNA-binding regulator protein Hfq